jgi:hypothetical protein
MSTRIVFKGGGGVVIAQDEANAVHAMWREHPRPATLDSSTAGSLQIDRGRIALVDEALAKPTGE